MKSTVQYSHYPISGAVVETGGRYLDFRLFSPYEIKMPSFYFDIDERKNCQQFITDVQVFLSIIQSIVSDEYSTSYSHASVSFSLAKIFMLLKNV